MHHGSAWSLLFAAGGLEIVMAIALKYAAGWSRLLPSTIAIAAGLASLYLLTLALKDLPVGTAYAVWTGIGAVGIAAIGILLFGESASASRLLCIGMIVGGIAGLKLLA